jgi:protein SCO1/2
VSGSGRLPCVVAAALFAASVAAGPVYPDAVAPPIEIEQRLGAELPLGLAFVDASDRAVHLGDFFGDGVPVVLVLGYYRCPRLCETVMEGAVEALAESGSPRSAYRIVLVSIDPAETAADARARLRTDFAFADLAADRFARGRAERAPLDLQALVGDAAAIDRLAREVGFGFARHPTSDDATAVFDHATGFVVVTPRGRISRYLLGVRHDPLDVRRALDEARGNSIGVLVDRLVLLCAHLDPTLGHWSAATLLFLRLVGVASAALLARWVWRHRHSPGSPKVRP